MDAETPAPPPAESARIRAMGRYYARVHAARRDLAEFAQLVVRDDHGAPIRLAPMHRQWIDHLDWSWKRNMRALLWAHFGAGKSSTLVCSLAAWLLGRDPNTRVKVVTNDDASARKRVGAIKRIMESVAYSHVFPSVRRGEKWTEHELYLHRTGHAIDPSLHARGILTTGVGGRVDVLLLDDVVDQRNSYDVVQRRKVLDLLEGTWLSRLEPDARVFAVGTPWHMDDAWHHLVNRRGWSVLIQKVADDCSCLEPEVVADDLDGYPGL